MKKKCPGKERKISCQNKVAEPTEKFEGYKEEKLIGLFVLSTVHSFRFSYIFHQFALKV